MSSDLKGPFFTNTILLHIVVIWIFLFFYGENNKKDHIQSDVVVYYGYVPATFICKDITLKFLDKNKCQGRYWPLYLPNGNKVFKMSMGMAFLYTPFFFIGHLAASFLKEPQNGYSAPYQVALAFGSFFYLILGFHFLKKLLLVYFNDLIVGLVIIALFFGTNLFSYSTIDFLMPHVYLFSLVSMVLYLTHKIVESPGWKRIGLLSFLLGLISLIRPSNIILTLIPLLYGIRSFKELENRIRKIIRNKGYLLLGITAFIIPWIPQFIYWKVVTGQWLFYSYYDETFFFSSPHILEGLFGYRKGLFVYTPLLLFAFFGLFYLRKKVPDYFVPILIFLPLFIYIVFSWWCWWYGGSFGQRPFIDIFPVLSIPLACFIERITRINYIKYVGLLLLEIFIGLNLFQTWQFKRCLIHYDSMSYETYWSAFLSLDFPKDWDGRLKHPDYLMAKLGNEDELDLNRLNKIDIQISLKALNSKYVSCEISSTGELVANRDHDWDWEKFTIRKMSKDTFYLKAANNKFVYVNEDFGGKLEATKTTVQEASVFNIHSYHRNEISIKYKKNFVCLDPNDFKLKASSEPVNSNSSFTVVTVK